MTEFLNKAQENLKAAQLQHSSPALTRYEEC